MKRMCRTLAAIIVSLFSTAAWSSVPADLLNVGYSAYAFDKNGDGCPDYLLRPPFRVTMIDTGEIGFPIFIRPKSAPIMLLSASGCKSYSVINAVSDTDLKDKRWTPSDYRVVIGDTRGDGGGTMLVVPSASGSQPMFNLVRDPVSLNFSLRQMLLASDFLIGTAGTIVSFEYIDTDGRSDLVVRQGAQVVAVYSSDTSGAFSTDTDDNRIVSTYAVWKTFLGVLAKGDANEALKSVAVGAQDRFRAALTAQGADLAGFAGAIQDFDVIAVKPTYVKAIFTMTVNGSARRYFAVFGQDADNTWRIFSM